MNLEKLVQRCPTSSHRCIPIMTQRKALPDSDLEDGELRKMLASPLYTQSRGDCKSFRIPAASEKLAAMIQERGASAKRTQADLRESLMSSSSEEPRAYGKPDAIFSSGGKEPGNLIKSSVFEHAEPSNLERSLFEGNEDHLLHQARSDLMKQEHQVGFLNDCISELQQQAYAQRLELQDVQHGCVESRREQEKLSLILRDTEIRSMNELGEMKRAQEPRVDEVSVQILRKTH